MATTSMDDPIEARFSAHEPCGLSHHCPGIHLISVHQTIYFSIGTVSSSHPRASSQIVLPVTSDFPGLDAIQVVTQTPDLNEATVAPYTAIRGHADPHHMHAGAFWPPHGLARAFLDVLIALSPPDSPAHHDFRAWRTRAPTEQTMRTQLAMLHCKGHEAFSTALAALPAGTRPVAPPCTLFGIPQPDIAPFAHTGYLPWASPAFPYRGVRPYTREVAAAAVQREHRARYDMEMERQRRERIGQWLTSSDTPLPSVERPSRVHGEGSSFDNPITVSSPVPAQAVISRATTTSTAQLTTLLRAVLAALPAATTNRAVELSLWCALHHAYHVGPFQLATARERLGARLEEHVGRLGAGGSGGSGDEEELRNLAKRARELLRDSRAF